MQLALALQEQIGMKAAVVLNVLQVPLGMIIVKNVYVIKNREKDSLGDLMMKQMVAPRENVLIQQAYIATLLVLVEVAILKDTGMMQL